MGLTALQKLQYNLLQALDDAIEFRLARLAGQCADCGPDQSAPRCDDHACDVALISRYRQRSEALLSRVDKQDAARAHADRTWKPRGSPFGTW